MYDGLLLDLKYCIECGQQVQTSKSKSALTKSAVTVSTLKPKQSAAIIKTHTEDKANTEDKTSTAEISNNTSVNDEQTQTNVKSDQPKLEATKKRKVQAKPLLKRGEPIAKVAKVTSKYLTESMVKMHWLLRKVLTCLTIFVVSVYAVELTSSEKLVRIECKALNELVVQF